MRKDPIFGWGLNLRLGQGGEISIKNTLNHTKTEDKIQVEDVLLDVDGMLVDGIPFDQVVGKFAGSLKASCVCRFKRRRQVCRPNSPQTFMWTDEHGDSHKSLLNFTFNDDSDDESDNEDDNEDDDSSELGKSIGAAFDAEVNLP